jgi:UDP-2,3-diacylglucosamine pyrophosphatase LpxH
LLLFLSDLHLMDGTAGRHRLEPETFREIFKELALQARQVMPHLSQEQKDIKLVLLGDIFELVRSEQWFIMRTEGETKEYIELKNRPWGSPSEKTEHIANRIMEDIITENTEVLSILSGSEWRELGFPTKPNTIYIPGNHDRLCNLYPSLRKKVIQVLDLPEKDSLKEFPQVYENDQYGVFARHGHEWDSFNFEGDYKSVPIGDVIAAEIATKLPLVVQKNIQHLNLSKKDKQQVADNFRHLFDVRPISAIVPWLSYHVQQYDDEVQQVINQSFQETGKDFLEIPFVQKWIEKHSTIWNPFDDGHKIKWLGTLFKTFNIAALEIPLKIFDKLKNMKGIWSSDPYIAGAKRDLQQSDKQISFILYGHTHAPIQHTLDINGEKGRLYLNTGTWRPKYYQALSKQGFSSRNSITFTILYKKGEIRTGKMLPCPSFETWTGALSENE